MAPKLLSKKPLFAGWQTTIMGTDLSGAVLSAARAGSYDEKAVRLIDSAQRQAFFDLDKAKERWIIKPDVKALVTWKQHNLLRLLEEQPFDCIFLKNVLIYFDTAS